MEVRLLGSRVHAKQPETRNCISQALNANLASKP